MNRTGLALSAMLATIGITQVLFPAQVAQLFALDTAVALLALTTAVIAIGACFGPLKFIAGSRTARIVGFMTFMVGLAFIASPTILGLRSSFLPIADIFLVIESGIMMQLIGLEKKHEGVLSPLVYVSVSWQILQRRLHRGSPTATASH